MQTELVNRNNPSDWVISPPLEFHFNVADDCIQLVARLSAPKPDEVVRMLTSLRMHHRWTRGFLGAVLGVSASTVLKWERGERRPCGSASKLAYLLFSQLIAKDGRIRTCWDLACWGKLPGRFTPEEMAEMDPLELVGTYFVPEAEILAAAGETVD